MWHGFGKPIVGGCFENNMLRCPNCGSSAQIEFVGTEESETTVLELYQCGCGSRIQRFLKRDLDVYWSPTGTMLGKKKYK